MRGTAKPSDAFAGYLPRLVNAYHRGLLVPFLGAGMSAATDARGCPTWDGFVERLEKEAGISSGSGDLIRRANHATRVLGRESPAALRRAVRAALYEAAPTGGPEDGPEPTESTRQLASIWWPLVLTTNYDDLFVHAYSSRGTRRLAAPGDVYRTPTRAAPGPDGEIGYEIRVLGRAVEDCDRVLLSLRETGPSLLWALHGFLPRKAERSQRVDALEEKHARQLSSELVIGHEAYQRIAHAAVHYRRAFAEVYRQRSFLFLGSSLTDVYLLGLFAEVQELYGRSSLPHFAMIQKGQADPEFLQTRFNILCIEYGEHKELPGLLERMSKAIEMAATRGTRWEFATESTQGAIGHISFEHSDLPLADISTADRRSNNPASKRCIVFGSAPDGTKTRPGLLPFSPHVGEGIREATKLAGLPNLQIPSNWRVSAALRKGHSSFADLLLELKPPAGQTQPGHAVVTAWSTSAESATRDLRQISIATQAAMTWAAINGFEEVHMPLLATGRGSQITGRTALVEMARGYACWLERNDLPRVMRLVLHLRNRAALFELTSGRTDVVELLSLPSVFRFWLEVIGAGEGTRSTGTERELMLYPADTALSEVLSDARLSLDRWSAEVDPPPVGGSGVRGETDPKYTLEQIGLVPGATLRFRRFLSPKGRTSGSDDRSSGTLRAR